ncbi:MAG: GntR family transcriptional regulator [Chloroflexota bacterium]|nr:GntR family transcriptional regulator [Chloroflexota bacterium]
MIDLDSAKPLYEQIKAYIVSNIQAGVFTPDARIPSERALSEQFGVSRLTVKRAIDELTQHGVLYVQIGKGTYISRPKVMGQLEQLTSFSEEMSGRGQHPSSRVLEAAIIPASVEAARALRLAPGAPLFRLVRLRQADATPMAIERTHLPALRVPGILDRHDFSRESLYGVLRVHYSINLTHAEQTIEARLATDEESRLLAIEPNAPILYMTRLTYADGDDLCEYALSAYSGGRYKFQAVLRHL